ncbi:hypothetical protein [Kribbella albertanoniae]|uniref:Carbohydrate-binding protein n=1 Tax=Kribbella albertanoniae TaxID=1266829 RepID=A0A4R4QCB1_9ACTN|nr:hypothetical protein [Kribbella albertanoniae]TDC33047.1 hypothetical protein E1261_06955 [Kribbella albertanoniae]
MRLIKTAACATILAISLLTASQAQAYDPLYWTEQVQISGLTSAGPGACGTGTTVWKGESDPDRVYINIDGRNWTLPDTTVRTRFAPDVECLDGGVRIVAWTGLDNHVYITVGRGPMLDWSAPHRLTGTDDRSVSGPSISANRYWDGRYGVSVAWHDDSSPVTNDAVMYGDGTVSGSWGGRDKIPPTRDTLSSDGVSVGDLDWDRDGSTAVVWRKLGTTQMFYSFHTVPGEWSTPREIGGGGGTSFAPEIDDGIVIWRGIGNDNHLWYTRRTGPGAWQPQAVVCGAGGTSRKPALGTGRVVWKGISGDPHLWESRFSQEPGGVCRS